MSFFRFPRGSEFIFLSSVLPFNCDCCFYVADDFRLFHFILFFLFAFFLSQIFLVQQRTCISLSHRTLKAKFFFFVSPQTFFFLSLNHSITMSPIKWSAPLVMNELMAITKLPLELQKAALAAVTAHTNAYSPYSNFRVGAALLHDDGSVTSGCNYENCTLQSCCAERCAIVRANVEGRRCANAVAVYGRGYTEAALANPPPADTLCTPCGLCRQLLAEVADLSQNFEEFVLILVAFDTTHAKLVRLADFLPGKFGPSDIGIDVTKLAKTAP